MVVRKVLVAEVLVAGGILLVGYGVYVVSCKLRRRWYPVRGEEQDGEGARQPLIAGESSNTAKRSTDVLPSFSRCSTDDTYNTTKRPKSSIKKQEIREVARSPEDEVWGAPIATGADDGVMGNKSPMLSSDLAAQSSNLLLEVISGPSAGIRISQQSKGKQGLSLTVGRIPQNDLVLNDPEVSGKHALISWNSKISKWELVDMGSLNGTLVNYRSVAAVHSVNAPIRQRGNPVGLVDGDIVTLGSTSQMLVRVLSGKKALQFSMPATPFGVGLATDAMTIRRGGKQLPMEDVSLCEWPLRGFQEAHRVVFVTNKTRTLAGIDFLSECGKQFGVFCIFDGHGGAAAAEAAGRLMPEKLSNILSVDEKRTNVLSQCDAADVLQDAFRETEAALDHEYEGCTATVLLVWWSKDKVFAQCANVGDSACVFSIEDKQIAMTEDHRLTSFTERCRLLEMGKKLKDGETRLCGMNIVRALGDKFLKEQDACFSSQPYISEVVAIEPESRVLAVMASDGLWDVMSPRRALNFIIEARDGKTVTAEGRKFPPQDAEGMAEMLVSKARALRTKDNTSVIVLDFGCNSKNMFRTV